jgi:hypothetical protein
LRVISVSDPAYPVEVGACATPADARDVVVCGEYAYVTASDAGLRVISVADPSHPVEVGYCETPDRAHGVAVVGDYAYVASYGAGLRVISVADPAHPVEVGFCNTPDDAYGVAVAGDYAYVAAAQSELRIVSIANPERPVEVGYADSLAVDVAVEGGYAYVMPGALSRYVRAISVVDPSRPVEVGHYRLPGRPHYVALSGGYAFVTDMLSMTMLQLLPPGDLDIDGESLDVAADTLRLQCPSDTGIALGEFVLVNTSASYNPDTGDGPSVSPVSAIEFSGTLTGPGGTMDSTVLRNLPSSLAEGQSVVCTLAVRVPGDLRNGNYNGSITISGRDTASLSISETFYVFISVSRELGDIDVDSDSLDVSADTLRLRGSDIKALGAFVLSNTSPVYNPDPEDGPSLSRIDSLSFSGSLTGPGGILDSIWIPNLPSSLAEGQAVICSLAVFTPTRLRDGEYAGSIIITGKDTSGVLIRETFRARLSKLGDLDVDGDLLDVVHDTADLRTQPAGPVYHPYAKARFMLVNTSSAYNPDAADGPSRSPLREVEVEAKVEGQGRAAPMVNSRYRIMKSRSDFHSSQSTLDSSAVGIYVLNLPESLAVGQAVECTLALALPVGATPDGYTGWVTISAIDTLGYQVRDSFFLAVRGPGPRQNLDSLRVAPIPFKPNQNPEHDAIHFQGLTAGARVIVYDASGQSVWGATESGDGHLKWDAKVASGIYVYLVVAKEGASKVGKLSVIR